MFRYFGSKSTTAVAAADIALKNADVHTVADAFGGLGNIGAEFRRRGCSVTTCDLLNVAHAYQHTRLSCQRTPSFGRVRRQLGITSLDDVLSSVIQGARPSDWFSREYARRRQFFTVENAQAIASTWALIGRWVRRGLLTEAEKNFLIASFVDSVDACANTAGTYYAHLKHWDRKALKPYGFKWFPTEVGPKGTAILGDALTSLRDREFDVLYLDPPYNNRDYSRYYHLPETLAKFRAVPIDITSAAGQPVLRATEGSSIREAMKIPYLQGLIEEVGWKRLIVQYACGAYIDLETMKRTLRRYGKCSVTKLPALGYRTLTGSRAHTHYVFVVDK